MRNAWARLRHIRTRRQILDATFSMVDDFALLEQSCVPSYCHPNFVLAMAAWWRLIVAAELATERSFAGPVLDFGSSVGEIHHLLPPKTAYHYIEENEPLAAALAAFIPEARRHTLDDVPLRSFSVVFALDSLEHNTNRSAIVDQLYATLADDGLFILSGPTENPLYHLGRSLAGFHGGYHKTNVYGLEREMSTRFRQSNLVVGPLHLPLFRVSSWEKPLP